VRSSASGLAIGGAYPRRHGPERIRSAGSRSRTRSTGIIHEGRGLARTVRRISRSGGVSSGGSRQLLRCWRRLKMVERRDDPAVERPAGVGRLRDGDGARIRRGSPGTAGNHQSRDSVRPAVLRTEPRVPRDYRADRGIVRLADGAPRTRSDQPDAAAHDRFSRRGRST
jgi:hypothetical protein